ncbi:MAG TPA: c-type cytochrome [Thermomicrobiales bacterium]|jgi:mono/diheme cytochrome c family protein|nr:c-type cytochrome [Thermomicrobiales bacterium]
MRRGIILAVVIGLAVAGLLGGVFQGEAHNAAPKGTPAASPAASPSGSPVALVGDVKAGKALASQCLACHTIDGKVAVGPTWLGLYGSEVELEDGTTVVADDAYLIASIKDPNAQVVKGFPKGAMPPYGSILTDQNIIDIVAYIRSLADE